MSIERQNDYLDQLINPSFQGVNRFFILSVENNADRIAHTEHRILFSKIEIKD